VEREVSLQQKNAPPVPDEAESRGIIATRKTKENDFEVGGERKGNEMGA